MPTLLHIDASPRGDYSVSRQLSAAAVKAWQAKNPTGTVVTRDLTKTALSFVDLDWIMGAYTPAEQHSESHKKALAISDELIAELLSADEVILGAPMYNFALPAVVKAWIDHICRAGKTFRYGANGAEGLAGGRKIVAIIASAGAYEAGAAYEPFDYEVPYLRHIFGFLGISDVAFIQAGGTMAIAQGGTSMEDFVAPLLPKIEAAV